MNAPFDIDRERMRANALRHRATHEPSRRRPISPSHENGLCTASRPFGWVSTFAVVLVVLTVLYFGWQFSR